MKNSLRFSIFFLLLNLIISKVESQNTYDTYGTACNGNNPLQYPLISITGYTGEYQIFLEQSYWATRGFPDKTNRNAITYKIELVSFPFATNCIGCQILPINKRILKMPDANFPYTISEKSWVRDPSPYGPAAGNGLTFEYKLRREFSGTYQQGVVDYGMTDPATLASYSFRKTVNSTEEHADRIIYPHSILKHTFYMHCDASILSAVVDSFSFVLDHTRGRSRYYPFVGTNYIGSTSGEHDITIVPSILLNQDWAVEANYDNSLLIDFPTINYFPLITPPSNCASQIPDDYFPDDYSTVPSPENFIRPSPYSLVNTFLGNATAIDYIGFNANSQLPGIKQEYVIDQPIDLTLINPSEKIIYNPSEVAIDIPVNPLGRTLIFPTGYAFKTVSGIYPSATEVYAADPNGLYHYPENIPAPSTLSCDDVGNTSDNIFSYYFVKSGSTLLIEPCVGLYDTKIIVEAGGKVTYDPLQTYGNNYSIDNFHGAGGTIDEVNFTLIADCAHDCYDISKYDQTDIIISGNTIWTGTSPLDINADGILRIAKTLRIESGKTLTINGALRLEFGENGKIIVEKTAKLIVNGNSVSNPVVITSADICKQSMWEGIEVWGDKNSKQAIGTIQGYVKLTNVTLSNARTGITTQDRNNPIPSSTSGGIIHCQNVHFTNNFEDVEFLSYHNIMPYSLPPFTREIFNISFFMNCVFETTAYLNDIHYKTSNGRRFATPVHFKMGDVKDLRFYACTFQNTAKKVDGVTPLFDTDLRGTGIKAQDATFGLYAGPANANTFKNLSEGVWCISADATDYFSCTGNNFINNVHGLILEKTNNSAINSNHFEIPASESNIGITDDPFRKGYNKPVGLYLIGATDFTAEENTFTSYGTQSTLSTPPEQFNYGMIVNNCTGSLGVNDPGSGIGYAYKNTFENINVSLQAELDNKSDINYFSGAGLEFKCNTFNNRITSDVAIPDGPNSPGLGGGITIPSLIRDQGLCINALAQAGNSYPTCNPIDGMAEQLNFGQSSKNNNSDFLYSDQPSMFSCTNITTADNECYIGLGANTCPSNFSICGSIPCLYAYYNNAQIQAKQSLSAYYQLVDGGNTASLLYSISNIGTPVGQLKNLLLSKSPYLSDTVLISYLHPPVATSPGTIKQVLLANSPLTKKVMNVVQNGLPGLPQGIINQIQQAQTGVSARREKESEVDYYKFQANLSEVKLKQAYLAIDNLDSLKKISEKDTTLQGLFKLMEVLIGKGDYSEAQICHAKIVNKEIPNISDHSKFNRIRLDLAQQGKTWLDMSTSQHNTIKQIYENNPETAINARAVLALTKGLKYERYPYDISSNSNHSPIIINTKEKESDQESDAALTNYPNPFTNETIIKAILPENETDGELVITDVMGKIINKYPLIKGINSIAISNTNLTNGIYFYYMIVNGVKIKTNKMVRTK